MAPFPPTRQHGQHYNPKEHLDSLSIFCPWLRSLEGQTLILGIGKGGICRSQPHFLSIFSLSLSSQSSLRESFFTISSIQSLLFCPPLFVSVLVPSPSCVKDEAVQSLEYLFRSRFMSRTLPPYHGHIVATWSMEREGMKIFPGETKRRCLLE